MSFLDIYDGFLTYLIGFIDIFDWFYWHIWCVSWRYLKLLKETLKNSRKIIK